MDTRIQTAYKKAYNGYREACERYDNLVLAYRVLKGLEPDKHSGSGPDARLPHTADLMRHMIAEAAIEKSVISTRARECAKYLIAN